jgi:L-ascorbate metabolism protein UlaG (beta-lactamase superfamily)
MNKLLLFLNVTAMVLPFAAYAQQGLQKDTFKTSAGDLEIVFIGHGTLMFTFGGKVIHLDPVSEYADYSKLPKADVILVTHEHRDHLDPKAIDAILTEKTRVIVAEPCGNTLKGSTLMKNGEVKVIDGVKIEAVPAYNLVNMRSVGVPFHPKGAGNGYVLTFADKRIYVAGDSENTAEMKNLKGIDIAFLPMNLPYTMTPEMVADAAKAFKPKVLYPYHFGETDTSELLNLMKDVQEVEVRIRKLQ